MILTNEGLVQAAEKAGINMPPDLDEYDKLLFPYWHLFRLAQLERPMTHPDSHFKNAKRIAAISVDHIGKVQFVDIEDELE